MQVINILEAVQLPKAAPKGALTKIQLIHLLFAQIGLNKSEAKEVVDAFFEEINSALERGDAVRLSGFGNFKLLDKVQRPGRNPKTKEWIPVSARRVVKFSASKMLNKHIAENAQFLDNGTKQ